jgi:hypothetical protein
MYWGSVDSWNTVTFTNTSTSPVTTYTVSGSDLQNTAYFPCATTSKPTCAPSFEFDNIEWVTCGSCSAPISGVATGFSAAAPTPEPSSLLLLGSGVWGTAGWLRRRQRSRKSQLVPSTFGSQNRNDRQLSPPSILRNSDISIGKGA